MAFQRTFIRGPENCSEADVWGSLERSDLDIIMFKRSHNNLKEKHKGNIYYVAKCNLGKVNLEAMLVSGVLSHMPWDGLGALSGAPTTQLCSCLLAVLCCVSTHCFYLPVAKHVQLSLDFCYHKHVETAHMFHNVHLCMFDFVWEISNSQAP